MAIRHPLMTAEDFDTWANLPENGGHHYEYIAGEIVDVVSNPKSSKLGMRIGRYLAAFVDDNELGHVTGADGGYQVSGERYMPDVGYISFERMPELQHKHGYVITAPDLAVEVISPTDSAAQLSVKVSNYLADGTVVWVVSPEEQVISIHRPGKAVETISDEDAILTGGEVLPGFELAFENIFK